MYLSYVRTLAKSGILQVTPTYLLLPTYLPTYIANKPRQFSAQDCTKARFYWERILKEELMLKPKLHLEDEIAKISKHSRLESPRVPGSPDRHEAGGESPRLFPSNILIQLQITSQESIYDSVDLGTNK